MAEDVRRPAHHVEAFREGIPVGQPGAVLGWQCLTCGAEAKGFDSITGAEQAGAEHVEQTGGGRAPGPGSDTPYGEADDVAHVGDALMRELRGKVLVGTPAEREKALDEYVDEQLQRRDLPQRDFMKRDAGDRAARARLLPAPATPVVVASSRPAALAYARDHGWSEGQCVLASSPAWLRGLTNVEVHYVPGWESRKDRTEIESALTVLLATGTDRG